MAKGKPGERMWVFEGSSYYVGSIPILLDEIVERYLPQVDRSVGLLFASPHRHITLVRGRFWPDLMGSIGLLATFAAEEFTQQAGALSPRLMISHMGEIVTFTDVKWKDERSAELEVKPTAYLMEKLNQGWEDGEGGASGAVVSLAWRTVGVHTKLLSGKVAPLERWLAGLIALLSPAVIFR